MTRNVDIVAVGLLLAGIAVYSQVRRCVLFQINSHSLGVAHYPRMIVVPPVRPIPPLPHIKVLRD